MNTIKCHIQAIAIKQRKPSVNTERQGTAPPGQSQSSPGNMQQLSYATKFPTLLHWWILSNSNTYLNNYNLHHTFFALRFGVYCLHHLWGLTRVNSDKQHGPIRRVAIARKMKSQQETTSSGQIATRDVLKFRWATWDTANCAALLGNFLYSIRNYDRLLTLKFFTMSIIKIAHCCWNQEMSEKKCEWQCPSLVLPTHIHMLNATKFHFYDNKLQCIHKKVLSIEHTSHWRFFSILVNKKQSFIRLFWDRATIKTNSRRFNNNEICIIPVGPFENHNWVQTKMAKVYIYTHFQAKGTQKPHPLRQQVST